MRTFSLPSGKELMIAQDTSSGAGTGAVVWDAAWHLFNWLYQGGWLHSCTSAIELGSGTGVVAIAMRLAGVPNVVATDGSQSLCEMCRANGRLNGVVAHRYPSRVGNGHRRNHRSMQRARPPVQPADRVERLALRPCPRPRRRLGAEPACAHRAWRVSHACGVVEGENTSRGVIYAEVRGPRCGAAHRALCGWRLHRCAATRKCLIRTIDFVLRCMMRHECNERDSG